MKKLIKTKNKTAKWLIREAKKNHPIFLKRMEEIEPLIRRTTTIKSEKGLRLINA